MGNYFLVVFEQFILIFFLSVEASNTISTFFFSSFFLMEFSCESRYLTRGSCLDKIAFWMNADDMTPGCYWEEECGWTRLVWHPIQSFFLSYIYSYLKYKICIMWHFFPLHSAMMENIILLFIGRPEMSHLKGENIARS